MYEDLEDRTKRKARERRKDTGGEARVCRRRRRRRRRTEKGGTYECRRKKKHMNGETGGSRQQGKRKTSRSAVCVRHGERPATQNRYRRCGVYIHRSSRVYVHWSRREGEREQTEKFKALRNHQGENLHGVSAKLYLPFSFFSFVHVFIIFLKEVASILSVTFLATHAETPARGRRDCSHSRAIVTDR